MTVKPEAKVRVQQTIANEDVLDATLIYKKRVHKSARPEESEYEGHLYTLLATPVSLPLKSVAPVSDVENALYDAEHLDSAADKFPKTHPDAE